jgi:8-oxo-dGTP pyrophosphatase MutT (NUDIX family)
MTMMSLPNSDLGVGVGITSQRMSLWIGTHCVGSALPADIEVCPAIAALVGQKQGVMLPTDQAQCNTLLADWAQALHSKGRLRAWRNELLNVSALPDPYSQLNDLPPALAQLERGAARVLGILTHAVHLVGLSRTGDIWMQQRALNKATDPGLWDTLSGGLLSAGDSLHTGVLRETHEEAGLLKADLLNLISRGMVQQSRTVPDGRILEAIWTFTATVKDGVLPHNLDGEAMGFACLTPSELTALVNSNKVTQEAVLALRMAGVLSAPS